MAFGRLGDDDTEGKRRPGKHEMREEEEGRVISQNESTVCDRNDVAFRETRDEATLRIQDTMRGSEGDGDTTFQGCGDHAMCRRIAE